MKAGELKLRLSNSAINLIDTYFNGNSITEKFINSTLKIILKQNLYRVDSILPLFADQNGDLNVDDIINEYANMFDDNGLVFDIKKYINNDTVKNLIPDKILVIKREDILNILK